MLSWLIPKRLTLLHWPTPSKMVWSAASATQTRKKPKRDRPGGEAVPSTAFYPKKFPKIRCLTMALTVRNSATGAKPEEEIVSFATKRRRYWGRCREARLVKSFEKIAEVAKIWSSPRCQLLRGQPPILQTYINIWVRLAMVLGTHEYIRHFCCQHFSEIVFSNLHVRRWLISEKCLGSVEWTNWSNISEHT